jgi:hypothetical protein
MAALELAVGQVVNLPVHSGKLTTCLTIVPLYANLSDSQSQGQQKAAGAPWFK